jgi:8-oxo-dGTP pyrophosphatase MutT (NUDIX family)
MMQINEIRQAFMRGLPGLAAQLRMAPPNRPSIAPQNPARPVRQAGVLLLLYPNANTVHFVLTRRTDRLGSHSGQISFPGGRKDESDADLVATALRETREELGIATNTIEILGALTPLYVPPSNFNVHPVVGWVPRAPRFHPNPDEVAEVIEPPLSILFDEAAKGMAPRALISQNGKVVDTPHYRIGTHLVWGATAMVLSELEALLRRQNEEG